MNTSQIKFIATAALLVLALPARGDLIVNGGFEDPQRNANSWGLYSSILGWYPGEGEKIEIQNNVAGASYEGNQHVELDSTKPSSIYQDVATSVGQSYRLSFAFAGRPGTNLAEENVMSIYWGDTMVDTLVAPSVTPGWAVYSFDVMADSNMTTLGFRDVSANNQNSYGVYLDDVRLIAVSEPGTLMLFGLGLLGLGFGSRRLKN